MMLEEFDVGTTRTVGSKGEPITSVHQIDTWAKSQHLLLSTVFLRQLALFMIGNPQWFKISTLPPANNLSDKVHKPHILPCVMS